MDLENDLITKYGACYRTLGVEKWNKVFSEYSQNGAGEDFPSFLRNQADSLKLPGFMGDLILVEEAYHQVRYWKELFLDPVDSLTVNPTVQLLQLNWKNIVPLIVPEKFSNPPRPVEGEELVMIWKNPSSQLTRIKVASSRELLVLKILVEDIPRKNAAAAGNTTVGYVDIAFAGCINSGLII